MTDFNERIADLENTPISNGRFVSKALPLLREMQAEIDRLREGLKTMAQNFAEMEKLRSQFYTEKEQSETALLFANREVELLREMQAENDRLKADYQTALRALALIRQQVYEFEDKLNASTT